MLPRSDNAARPGDFPLGSRESRAAARLLLNSLANTRRRIEIVSHIPRPGQDGTKPHVSDWNDFGDALMRMVYVPPGMSFEEALKLVDRPKSSTSSLPTQLLV